MSQKFTRNLIGFLFLLAILTTQMGWSQNNKTQNYKSKVSNSDANFFEIVAQKRAEFAQMDLSIRANQKAYKQFERWAYIWRDKVNKDGSFPTEANRLLSTEQYISTVMEFQSENRSSTTSPWLQIGPINRPTVNGYAGYPGKGRINVIAEDPTNTQIMYAGSAAGGIWKTTNGGNLWNPKSDFLAGIGVSDILVDPNNTNIIYMATGDEDGEHISSIGVFKSLDAGETWNPTGLTFSLNENEYIRDLEFAPGNTSKIFALTNEEIKVTTDSGATWTNIPVTYPFNAFTEYFQTIIFDPNDANKVIVSDFWDAIYISTDGGANFAMHDIYQGGNNKKLLKLTTTANDNDFFYGLSQDGEFRKYRFAINNTAADLISTTTISGFNSQSGYDQCLAISPTNKNNIIVAGVNGYRSTDGGTTFSTLLNAYDSPPGAGFYVHADHHHLSFLADGVTVLNGHDGGIHVGPFNATSATPWADLSNTLIITQPYNISVTQESSGDNFMMANQDNDGFSKILKDGTRQWVSCLAGDGTSAAIDISDSNIRYLGGTNGNLNRSDNGYSVYYDSAVEILPTLSSAAFVSPMSVHPTVATTIYACHSDIKKSTDRGETWTALGTGLTGTKFIDVTQNGASIRIYTIGENGTAKRSDNDGTSWVTVNPPSGQVFNSFSAVPNSSIVYATVSAYNAGNKVFKSTDNGSTWTNISGDLPNIVMKKILYNRSQTNETLYLGTELGPYTKDNTSTNWVKMGIGLPNVRVDDLEINYTDQELYIGTFGRGMWKTSIFNGACAGGTKTWTGIWSPPGAPNGTHEVIIDAPYNTATHGNLEACSLTINNGTALTITAGNFAKVIGNITVDGTLEIGHEGSLVQVDNNATVVKGAMGVINVYKTTPNIAAQSFMIVGSPMSSETREGVYASGYIVRNHLTGNFIPNPNVAAMFPMANNFADDNGNNWINHTGALNVGEGYMVFPQPDGTSSGSYSHTYSQGTLNNGIVNRTLIFNGNQNASPNILANPYPSAIDATALLSNLNNNSRVNALYFWEHLTPLSPSYPGYNAANFDMGDISVYSLMGGVAAANGGQTPTKVIASGQGFGVKTSSAGDLVFDNTMRVTGPNDTYRTTLENRNRLWVNVFNETYGLGSTTLIGFSENTSDAFENATDITRIATPVSIYSELNTGEQLAINSLNSFDTDDMVPLSFSTQIEASQNYRISLQDLDGDSISGESIFLIDQELGTTTNLRETDYTFESNAGTYVHRFLIVFNNSPLNITQSSLDQIGIFPNPTENILTISSPTLIVQNAIVYDVRGRKLMEITFSNRNYTVNLSSLESAMYFVQINTKSGSLTKRILKK